MRLIDADKLLELIKDQKEREIGAYAKGINAGLNIVKSIINDETQTPTAYDVDKVVEQLEELRELDACDFDNCPVEYIQCCDCTQKRMAERAIKIVKDYGVDER